MSRQESLTGNAVLEAPPPLLAAEPPGATFLARGWKLDLKRLLAEVDTYEQCCALTIICTEALIAICCKNVDFAKTSLIKYNYSNLQYASSV
ncbi:hypothetical protein [Nostoc sp.]|uniref:hypothetical protein n=1 Tax=Nostoc sp. TaxID=1180 RepID=UPI002FF985E3